MNFKKYIIGFILTMYHVNISPLLAQNLTYPPNLLEDITDNYHGTLIADPFRWLESLESPQTQEWVEAQNNLAHAYLDTLSGRSYFQKEYAALRIGTRPIMPQRQWSFWVSRIDQKDGSRPYCIQDTLEGKIRIALNPKDLFQGQDIEVPHFRISPNGRYGLYTVTSTGAREMEVRVRDLITNQDLEDRIPGLKFNAPYWTADNQGFVYYRYTQIDDQGVDHFSKVFYHHLRTSISEDLVLCSSNPDETGATTWSEVSEGGRFVFIYNDKANKQQLSVLDLEDPHHPRWNNPLIRLNETRDGSFEIFGTNGDTLFIKSTRDAPNGKVMAVSLDNPQEWIQIIPESAHVLQHIRWYGQHFVALYREDVKSRMKIFSPKGIFIREIDLPVLGSTFNLRGHAQESSFIFGFDSYMYPLTVFHYDLKTNRLQNLGFRDTGHDPQDFITKQIFFSSKDGTRVPMFVTHRKDITLNQENATLLYGYGAGGIQEPMFRDDWFIWVKSGGILVVANIRGGEEYGKNWESAGRGKNKQNGYDDFIAAAENLISKGYTSPQNLCVHGVSNGGWLVGGVMTQRPDLFAAALPEVGVLDLLRFGQFTAGARWIHTNGDPRDPDDFPWLYALSPLHRIKENNCYPATLVMTAFNDDLVHPSQSYKFAAGLQRAQACDLPVLLKCYKTGGHNIGYLPDAMADLFAFMAFHTNLKFK